MLYCKHLSFGEIVKRLNQRGWKRWGGGHINQNNRVMYVKKLEDAKRASGENLISNVIFTREVVLPKRKSDFYSVYLVYPDIVKEQSKYYVSLLDAWLLVDQVKEIFGRYRGNLKAKLSVSDNGLWIAEFERFEGLLILVPVTGVLELDGKYYDVVSWSELSTTEVKNLIEKAEALTEIARGSSRGHELLSKFSTDAEFMKKALYELL